MFSRSAISSTALLLTLVSALTSGCSLAVPSAPSPSNPTRTTDTLEGSFPYQGTKQHVFSVTEPGLVEVRLTNLSPLSTMGIGVTVGNWTGDLCNPTSVRNLNARVGDIALSGTVAAGDYCITFYDSGNLPSTWTVTYTATVTHP